MWHMRPHKRSNFYFHSQLSSLFRRRGCSFSNSKTYRSLSAFCASADFSTNMSPRSFWTSCWWSAENTSKMGRTGWIGMSIVDNLQPNDTVRTSNRQLLIDCGGGNCAIVLWRLLGLVAHHIILFRHRVSFSLDWDLHGVRQGDKWSALQSHADCTQKTWAGTYQ